MWTMRRTTSATLPILLLLCSSVVACGGGDDGGEQPGWDGNKAAPGPSSGGTTGDDTDAGGGTTGGGSGGLRPGGDLGSDGGDTDGGGMDVDIDTIPWAKGGTVGYGVASKDTMNPRGENMFIAYSAYTVSLASAESWATQLYNTTLKDLGVRYIWAVQGPQDFNYSALEIGNGDIARALVPKVTAKTNFILMVGHSSGSIVSHELLGQLGNTTYDPKGVTNKKVVYFNLDGFSDGLTSSMITRMKHGYFVGAHMSSTGTSSEYETTMKSLGSSYSTAGGFLETDANGTGCNAGASWCVTMTLITSKPHNPASYDTAHDYSDWTTGHEVAHAYIDAKVQAAGLTP